MNEQSNNTRLGDVAYVVRSVEGATAIARGNITNSKIETVDEIHNRLMAYDDIKRERDELRELVYAWESRWKAEVEFAAKVSVKRDELQDILRKLLGIIPEPECHDFGHTKEERHTFFEKCPVMERYDALIAQAKEAAK